MKYIYILLLSGIIATTSSCTYTFPEDEVPTSGTADFTKLVTVGNSLTAGYMDGALYDAGQEASFANILATQMQLVGSGEFNQPDINAVDGDFGFSGGAYGRLYLKNPASPAPSPIIPGQAITDYSGDRSALNNISVPGIKITEAVFPGYGNPANGPGNYNPYFSRFASSPTTTFIADAAAANGTFITFWLGANDVLGYALAGATGNIDGQNRGNLTSVADFTAAYTACISILFSDGQKGIIANIPNINDIPHFTTVPWNAIPMDQATADAVNGSYAPYNGGLDLMVQAQIITQEEADLRYVVFKDGANGIVIFDTNLTDLTPYNPGLVSMRMANSDDLITLSAGTVLGLPANAPVGVATPLGEEYTLTDADLNKMADYVADFNAVIMAAVDSNPNLVLLDINTIFTEFARTGTSINGAGMDASIAPPFGAFSLDGIHPNQRGSAWITSLFIDKINETFESNIPNINPNNWPGNALPVPQ